MIVMRCHRTVAPSAHLEESPCPRLPLWKTMMQSAQPEILLLPPPRLRDSAPDLRLERSLYRPPRPLRKSRAGFATQPATSCKNAPTPLSPAFTTVASAVFLASSVLLQPLRRRTCRCCCVVHKTYPCPPLFRKKEKKSRNSCSAK